MKVKDAMNSALLVIGMRSKPPEERAFETAARIGKVEVDHGPTSCRTPVTVDYIGRAKARRKRLAAR